MKIKTYRHQQAIRTILVIFSISIVTSQCQSVTEDSRKYVFQTVEVNEPSSRLEIDDDPRIGSYNYDSYSISIIVDPCKGHNYDCCWDTFGTPEYVRRPMPTSLGWIWGLSQEGKALKCQKPCNGHWESPRDEAGVYDYTFRLLDADENNVWALSEDNQGTFKRNLDGTTQWEFISGTPIKSLTASSPHSIFAIQRDSALYECRKPCSGEWEPLAEPSGHPRAGALVQGPPAVAVDGSLLAPAPAKLAAIDGDATHLWALTSTGRLFVRRLRIGDRADTRRWQDVVDAEWLDVSPGVALGLGPLRGFSVSTAAQRVFALDGSGGLAECEAPCLGGAWQRTGLPGDAGQIAQLDAGQVDLFATTVSGEVLVHRIASGLLVDWVEVPSTLRSERTSALVQAARASIPPGGLKQVSSSANPTLVEDFEVYVVAQESGVCLGASDEEGCQAIEDEGCRWSAQHGACESLVDARFSRLQDMEVVFNDETCIVLETTDPNGRIVREAGYALVESRVGADLEVIADAECVADGVRRVLRDGTPACWDHNSTVSATSTCFDADGTEHANCLNVAISSSSVIVQCGGDFDCGTFIEVHLPGEKEPVTEVRVPPTSEFTSGHRTIAVSLLFPRLEEDEAAWREEMARRDDFEELDMEAETSVWHKSARTFDFLNKAHWDTQVVDFLTTRAGEMNDAPAEGTGAAGQTGQTGGLGSAGAGPEGGGGGEVVTPPPREMVVDYEAKGRTNYILCRGDVELWWVQRTRRKFIVEFVKKFRIDSPICDFDVETDSYKQYRTLNSTTNAVT